MRVCTESTGAGVGVGKGILGGGGGGAAGGGGRGNITNREGRNETVSRFGLAVRR